MGVFMIQQIFEGLLFTLRCFGELCFEISGQDDIELLDATPATPFEAGVVVHPFLLTMSFLISAMALAGLRSLGQASVQFMMV